MKLINIYNKLFATFILIIIAIQLNAQILNNVGNRNTPSIHQTSVNEEYSGLAYHPCRNIFFMPVDDPINNNNSQINIVGYDLNVNGIFYPIISNEFGDLDLNIVAENNTNTYNCVNFNSCNEVDNRNDLEGLTYLEQDYFVLVEERTNYIYFLEYEHSANINNRKFKILSRHNTQIGLSQPSNGLEGISYDRHNNRLFLVQEVNPPTLFCFPVTLPGNGSLGSITVSQTSSVVLTDKLNLIDAAGLFHVSQIVTADSELSDNLLILSEQSKKIFEVDLTVNPNNTISIELLGEKSINTEIQPEGITVYNNHIYIASERGDIPTDKATLSSYSLPNNFSICNSFNENCICIGCTDPCAANYDPNAVENDGTCSPYNDTCNTDCSIGPFGGIWDDVSCSCINEIAPVNGCTEVTACNYDETANCNDGSCITVADCLGICGGTIIPGAPCNDSNSSTEDDRYNENCQCVGDVIRGCTDACAANYNPNAAINDGSCISYDNTCNADCIVGLFDGTWDSSTCTCINELMPVNGCTNENACNYDETANCDDGSCQLIGAPCEDGVINDNCECVDICPEELTLSGTSPSDIFEVSNTIKSTAIMNDVQNVEYDAGASICLDKGFLANSANGAVFLAKIDGCTQLREGHFMEQTTSIKNFPNPFTGETTIEFELKSISAVSLVVRDVTGKIVATLLDEATTEEGVHQIRFDGTHLAQGVYYFSLTKNDQINTQKMILIK